MKSAVSKNDRQHRACRVQTLIPSGEENQRSPDEEVRWTRGLFFKYRKVGVLIKWVLCPFLIKVYWCTVEVKRPHLKRSEECGPTQVRDYKMQEFKSSNSVHKSRSGDGGHIYR